MPSDEYTSITRGPLKLKGAAGITKKKKKKDKNKDKKPDLERNLSTGGGDESALTLVKDTLERLPNEEDDDTRQRRSESGDVREGGGRSGEEGEGGNEKESSKTETERRFAEAKRKRVRFFPFPPYCECTVCECTASVCGRWANKRYLNSSKNSPSRVGSDLSCSRHTNSAWRSSMHILRG